MVKGVIRPWKADGLGFLVDFDDFLPLRLIERWDWVIPVNGIPAVDILAFGWSHLSLEEFALQYCWSSNAQGIKVGGNMAIETSLGHGAMLELSLGTEVV